MEHIITFLHKIIILLTFAKKCCILDLHSKTAESMRFVMEKVDFFNIKNAEFYIDKISSIYQTPTYTTLDVTGRRCNGFCIIEEGECVFEWSDGRQLLKKGGVIYLPLNSVHRMIASGDKLSFTRINFTTYNFDNRQFVFSYQPLVMCTHFDTELMDIVHKLNKLFLDGTASLKIKSKLYQLLDKIDSISSDKNSSAVNVAIEYIERHYTENIDLKTLVQNSYLSQASLYRAFKKETGMTPVEYKNHLRIEQAKAMLRTEEYTINEISDFLGFDSIYYFCRVFKQFANMSPSEYRNNCRIKA